MPYYIVSLAHTHHKDKFLTLWRPNNQGYAFAKESAGIYDEPEVGYHDSDSNLPIDVELANRLFIGDTKYFGELRYAIPNSQIIWDNIGVEKKKGQLIRKPSTPTQ